MTVCNYPPTPILDSLIKKYGSLTVFKKFLDKDGNVKDGAPKGLKEEQEALKKAKEE